MLPIKKLAANEPFRGLERTIVDFWSWAYSDNMSNTAWGVFAEFLVACALGITDEPKVEWLAYDLKYKGRKIEVKSSAYLQSWYQKEHSKFIFGIGEKRAWDPKTNKMTPNSKRWSDCYIFSLYGEKDKSKANVMDVSAWEFIVLPTKIINSKFKDQKTVGWKSLVKLTNPVKYANLKEDIKAKLFN